MPAIPLLKGGSSMYRAYISSYSYTGFAYFPQEIKLFLVVNCVNDNLFLYHMKFLNNLFHTGKQFVSPAETVCFTGETTC